MKVMNVILFFGIFFSVYGLVNFYIFIRGWEAIPPGSPLRLPYVIIFLACALSFIAGRLCEWAWSSPLSEALIWTGSFWLAAMLYFFLAVAILDILRLVNHFFPLFPPAGTGAYAAWKLRAGWTVTLIVAFVVAAGHVNALSPRIRELSLTIPKKVEGTKNLTIVVASDIHLGTIIGRRRLEGIVDRINGLRPDIVLLPGDIVDEDIGPVIRENLGETLRSISSGMGVFAVTGNHEYIGGAEAACRYMAEHGITVLRDSVARLGDGLYIVGREDRSSSQFGGKKRKPLEEVMAGVDTLYPVILMDHQPFGLDDAVHNRVDLQLSGHTHHGQLWPFNYITEALYEVSWGYKRKKDTHVYVSCGVGTWGPPVRTGNRPEIVLLHLSFSGI